MALRDAVYARDLLISDWYQKTFTPKWTLSSDENAKGSYGNTMGGHRASSGSTAGITGLRYDGLINDDPDDPTEVTSEIVRGNVHREWDEKIANRLNDANVGIRIGIQQRVHEEDWTGHVTTKEPGYWEHVIIPSEYDPDIAKVSAIGWKDPRTKAGELLDPVRFSAEVLAVERRRLMEYGYSGQHQQRPAPVGGGMFPVAGWRFYKPDGVKAEGQAPRPKGCYIGPAIALPDKMDAELISLDAAFRGNPENDRVAFVVLGKKKGLRFVLDVSVGNRTMMQTCTEFRRLIAKWPKAKRRLVEGKANGDAVVDMLSKEYTGLITVNPEGGKETRAAAICPEVESGSWYLPEGAPWIDDFITEFGTFPRGRRDDIVDAFTQGAVHLAESSDIERLRMLATK